MSAASPCTLDRMPIGARGRILAVTPEHRAALGREGVAPGTVVVLQASAPFGGPVIIGLGRARVALARSVARSIDVTLADEPTDAR